MFYSPKKISKIFQTPDKDLASPEELIEIIQKNNLESFHSDQEGTSRGRGYNTLDIPSLGSEIGFLSPLSTPKVLSVFVTKGGVLKTTLTLNFARMAALHGVRTLVIGLDMQCDITTSMGLNSISQEDHLTSAIEEMDSMQGLADFFFERQSLQGIIQKTDLPTLDIIPETPELVAVEQSLLHRSRREFWLSDKVIEPLKSQYDLFVIDCSPNWNQLITNALSASDLLVSPLECKINNYRNFQMFRHFIQEFKEEMNLNFDHIYVPTRLTSSRKLSQEIRDWYVNETSQCLPIAIKDSVVGEEATAMNVSIPEYQPGSPAAEDINQVLQMAWMRLINDVSIHSSVASLLEIK